MTTTIQHPSIAPARRKSPIQQDPEKLGGTPTTGTYRVPVETSLGYLASNSNLDEFLDAFDGTDRDTVLTVLGVIR